jgi:osmotically inducible lipoprotein OsmB
MTKSGRTLFLSALAALGLAACTTTGERVGGAGVGALAGAAVAGPVGAAVGGVAGAVTGPTVARDVGVPHRRYYRHRRHHRRTY